MSNIFKETIKDFKPIWILLGFLLVIAFGVYLYSLTPQAIQAEQDHQTQLQKMSCSQLYQSLVDNIPHGYTVGGADAIMDDYNKAIQAKGCFK